MTTLGIIRHGSTPWNKEGRSQGSSDIALDEDGILEAIKLAERLSIENWDVIYTSDLSRARQTAETIGNKKNIPVYIDSRLQEIGGGEIEGTTEAERIVKWGSNWKELELGAEKLDSVSKRSQSVMEDIIEKHENKHILIVSHGAFNRHLLMKLVPEIQIKEKLKNTSLTRLVKTSAGWNCDLFNCTIHLDKK